MINKIIVLLTMMICSSASAEELLFRISPGLTGVKFSSSAPHKSYDTHGIGAGFSLTLASEISPFVSVGGIYSYNTSPNIVATTYGNHVNFDSVSLTSNFLGAAINLYTLNDYYVLGALGFLLLEEESKNYREDNLGTAVNLSIGHERFVSPNWSLGFSLNMMLGNIYKDNCLSSDYFLFGPSFSATYR